jgi:hypothetical protein
VGNALLRQKWGKRNTRKARTSCSVRMKEV